MRLLLLAVGNLIFDAAWAAPVVLRPSQAGPPNSIERAQSLYKSPPWSHDIDTKMDSLKALWAERHAVAAVEEDYTGEAELEAAVAAKAGEVRPKTRPPASPASRKIPVHRRQVRVLDDAKEAGSRYSDPDGFFSFSEDTLGTRYSLPELKVAADQLDYVIARKSAQVHEDRQREHDDEVPPPQYDPEFMKFAGLSYDDVAPARKDMLQEQAEKMGLTTLERRADEDILEPVADDDVQGLSRQQVVDTTWDVYQVDYVVDPRGSQDELTEIYNQLPIDIRSGIPHDLQHQAAPADIYFFDNLLDSDIISEGIMTEPETMIEIDGDIKKLEIISEDIQRHITNIYFTQNPPDESTTTDDDDSNNDNENDSNNDNNSDNDNDSDNDNESNNENRTVNYNSTSSIKSFLYRREAANFNTTTSTSASSTLNTTTITTPTTPSTVEISSSASSSPSSSSTAAPTVPANLRTSIEPVLKGLFDILPHQETIHAPYPAERFVEPPPPAPPRVHSSNSLFRRSMQGLPQPDTRDSIVSALPNMDPSSLWKRQSPTVAPAVYNQQPVQQYWYPQSYQPVQRQYQPIQAGQYQPIQYQPQPQQPYQKYPAPVYNDGTAQQYGYGAQQQQYAVEEELREDAAHDDLVLDEEFDEGNSLLFCVYIRVWARDKPPSTSLYLSTTPLQPPYNPPLPFLLLSSHLISSPQTPFFFSLFQYSPVRLANPPCHAVKAEWTALGADVRISAENMAKYLPQAEAEQRRADALASEAVEVVFEAPEDRERGGVHAVIAHADAAAADDGKGKSKNKEVDVDVAENYQQAKAKAKAGDVGVGEKKVDEKKQQQRAQVEVEKEVEVKGDAGAEANAEAEAEAEAEEEGIVEEEIAEEDKSDWRLKAEALLGTA